MLGAVLQMCRNTSKDGNAAMSIYTLSETDSDYIRQAKAAILILLAIDLCVIAVIYSEYTFSGRIQHENHNRCT